MLIDKLKRVPPRGGYIPELDGLRFLAILGVVLFHAHMYFFSDSILTDWLSVPPYRWIEYAIGNGWYGVQLFFIISGFIITAPFIRHFTKGERKPHLGRYFLRRFKRIEIPYFIAIFIGFLLVPFYFGMTYSQVAYDLLLGMTYTHNLLKPEALNPLLSVAWTLELEIQFYLIAPLLCQLYRLKKQWLRVGLLVAGMLLFPLALKYLNEALPSVFWTKNFILHHLPYFFAGMIGIDLYLHRKRETTSYGWDGIALFFTLLSLILLSYWQTDLYEPLTLGLFVIAALKGRICKKILCLPLFTIFGGMCYSIYLFHSILLHSVLHYLPFSLATKQEPWNYLLILITIALVFLLCIPLYLLIEKPFMSQSKSSLKTKNNK